MKGNKSSNIKSKQQLQLFLLNKMEHYFEKRRYQKLNSSFYNIFSLIGPQDEYRIKFDKIFKEMKKSNDFNPEKLQLSPIQSRGIGSILGMAICDALGACTQFMDFQKQGHKLIKSGFGDIEDLIKQKKLRSRHGKNNVWTDDASMGIAMAFSLLLKDYRFDPIHIRYMFILWLNHGLGNGGRKFSIGLGGNIKISFDEFFNEQTQYAQKGNQFNNGNGSLMRLAPIPVAFSDNKQDAMKYSELQSLTTHNGLQAKQCCRLLASIIVDMINSKEELENQPNKDEKQQDKQNENIYEENSHMQDESQQQIQEQKDQPQHQEYKKFFLEDICNKFKSDVKGVQFLAKSQQQSQQVYEESVAKFHAFKHFNPSIEEDRNWKWKSKDFTYSKRRYNEHSGYVGSYCMDALSMALHTVWHTKNFKECALMNANMGGDCDTVGSIAGQIAGSMYGIDEDMLRLYSEMKDFTQGRYQVFLLAHKLVNKKGYKVQKNQEMQNIPKMQMQK